MSKWTGQFYIKNEWGSSIRVTIQHRAGNWAQQTTIENIHLSAGQASDTYNFETSSDNSDYWTVSFIDVDNNRLYIANRKNDFHKGDSVATVQLIINKKEMEFIQIIKSGSKSADLAY